MLNEKFAKAFVGLQKLVVNYLLLTNMAEFEKQKRHDMDWYVDLKQGFEDDHELLNAEHEP